ncbi:MAG: DNA repair exonuclease [Slackia sp.]|nr:DNA repair exonuclease [Slackia sp.]
MTFIHSGDIHLGAPFRGLRALSPAWADRLATAIPDAYDCVIQACIDHDVDFLLLAGDVFDTDKPSYAHYRRFVAGLKRLEKRDIPVYIIAGNHDPYSNWHDVERDLPSNAHLLPSDKPSFVLFEKDGTPSAVVAARGFSTLPQGEDISAGMTRAAALEAYGCDAPFCIGMLHTGLWMDPYKAPTSEKALMAAGMDYWALGHIHQCFLTPERNPKIAFCGCAQGRDIKETGVRGCLKVTLEKGMPNKVELIPTLQVDWEKLDVDVSSCVGLDAVLQACVRAMFDKNAEVPCEEMVARITLVGATHLHAELSDAATREALRCELNESYPSFYCDALLCATSPVRDKEKLALSNTFEGTVLRRMREDASDARSQLAYLQEEFSRRGLSVPRVVAEGLSALSERAEDRLLSMIADREHR